MAYLWEKHMFDKNSTIEISDPAVWEIIQKEGKRQEDQIELIASENYASPAVMAAQGSVLTNKYAEGYPVSRQWISQKVCWTMVFIRLQCISH